MQPVFLSIGKASKVLGIHINTLRLWERQGYITTVRTPGGHRRYLLSDLEKLQIEETDRPK